MYSDHEMDFHVSHLGSIGTGVQKATLLLNIARYCFLAASNLEVRASIGCGLSPQPPNPSGHSQAVKGIAFGSCCDYREGPICKVPLSAHRAASAAPSPQLGSQQQGRLELQWQDPAKHIWLPIELILFIKSVFSITRISSHPDVNIPGVSQGQPCTGISLSHSDDFSFCLWAQSRAALCKLQVGHTPQ